MMQRVFRLFRAAAFLAAACAVALSGCAYLNTLYNAETAYDAARQAHLKLLKLHPDTTVALSFEINTGYDTAVAKSLKVLQEFSKQKRWHDDALLLMGKALFYKGESSRAIRRLKQLIEEYPQSPLIPQAYLYLGKAYLHDDNLNKAEEVFSLILARYPEVNRSQEVSMLLAEIAVRRGGRALAIELLEKTRTKAKNEIRKMEVLLRIAELYMELGSYDQAVALLKSCPRRNDAANILVRVDLTLVSCYLEMRSLSNALAVIDAMLKNKAYFRHTAHIMTKKASALAAMDSTDAAIALYEKIADKYAADSIAGIAWYEVAIIYQKKKGDFEKARECYAKAIPLLKDARRKEDAQNRLGAIDTLMRHWHRADSASVADTTAPASPGTPQAIGPKTEPPQDAFRIAEVFWLRLDEPDSALKYYAFVAAARSDTASFDSVAKALYAAGWITLSLKKDTTRADSLFSKLIAAYPASEYAKAAQHAMGREVTAKTREDSACGAFVAVERRLVEDGDAARAARAYIAVYDSFPNADCGIRGLYAAAWLYDVVLEKNKTAYDVYQRLCSEHPASLLCTQEAKPRLQIVSDTMRVRQALAKSHERESAQTPGRARPGAAASDAEPAPPPADSANPTPSKAKSAAQPPAATVGGEAFAPDLVAQPPAHDRPSSLRQRMRERYNKSPMMQQSGTAFGILDSMAHHDSVSAQPLPQ